MFVSDAGYWDPGSVPRSTRVPPVLPATDVSLLPLFHPPRTPLALRCWKPTSKRLTSPVTSHSPPPLISHPLSLTLSLLSPFISRPLPLTPLTLRALVLVPYSMCRLLAPALASLPHPPSPSPRAPPSTMGRPPRGTPWPRWSHTPHRTEPLDLPPSPPPW